MKIAKFALTISRILAIVFLLATSVLAYNPVSQNVQAHPLFDSNAADAYNYPIRPGTYAWRAFTDHQQMVDACQIPDSALMAMSTKGLVKSIIDYPLLGDMGAYDSMAQGLEAVTSHFNGLSELFQRSDAGTELLSVYQSLDLKKVDNKNWAGIQKGAYLVLISEVETMLAQEAVLNSLDDEEVKSLATEASAKHAAKQNYSVFWQRGLETTSLLIERISHRHYSSKYPYTDYVQTPNGTNVTVTVDRDEMDPELQEYWNNYFIDNYPNAWFMDTTTEKYNCHSYAWYQQSSSNIRWMDDPSAYWEDNSYSFVNPPSYSQYSRLLYVDAYDVLQHSAYVVGGSGSTPSLWQVQSKWGPGPLMQHTAFYSPYYFITAYYYQLN